MKTVLLFLRHLFTSEQHCIKRRTLISNTHLLENKRLVKKFKLKSTKKPSKAIKLEKKSWKIWLIQLVLFYISISHFYNIIEKWIHSWALSKSVVIAAAVLYNTTECAAATTTFLAQSFWFQISLSRKKKVSFVLLLTARLLTLILKDQLSFQWSNLFKFSTMSTPARRRLMRDFKRLQVRKIGWNNIGFLEKCLFV